jgi:pimeloyl-ACP methyl ester carboxylesterase
MSVTTEPAGAAWWERALAHRPTSHRVEVDGASLHYQAWNARDTTKPVLLLAHGYRGHAHWWDWTAPWFVERFRVVALDFSGMGDSEWRPHYDGATFARDLTGLLERLGASPAIVIGHSMGGSSVLRACGLKPAAIQRAIIVDSWVRFPDQDPVPQPYRIGGGTPFATFAQARARYRLIPEQPVSCAPLLEHIALHSLREVEGGWSWKFDPDLPFGPNELDGRSLLTRIDTPIDFVYGELSGVVRHERARQIVATLPCARGPVMVPNGHHHLMLDQPLALISVLQALLA